MRVSGSNTGVLVSLLLAAALWADAAESRVLTGMPGIHRVDAEAGVLLYQSGWFLRADDLETGETRWTFPIPKNENHDGFSVGLNHSIFFSNSGQLSVVSHKTGKETDRLNVAGGRGKLVFASLDREDTWVALSFEQGPVLCELATRRQYQTPLAATDSIGGRWMPDGKTCLFTTLAGGTQPPPTRAQVWFWDPGVSEPRAGCVLESPVRMFVLGVLPGGQLFVREYDPGNPDASRAKIVDPETGALIREMARPKEPNVLSGALNKCAWWYEHDVEGNLLHVQDILTGEPLFSLPLPGKNTVRILSQPRMAGKDWIVTWEENNNVWLVPLEKDGAPRQILDGSRFLPGHVSRIIPPYMLCYQNTTVPRTSTVALYTLDGLEKKRSWTYTDMQGGSGRTMLSADTKRFMISLFRWENNVQTSKVLLLEDGQTEPLLEMEGEGVALSPDGGHALVVNLDKRDRIELVSVEKRAPIMAFTANREYGAGAAVFSPTGRRAAVFHHPSLTVVDLYEGMPRREMSFPMADQNVYINSSYGLTNTMCFSPDESMLLAAGYGKTWLFRVATGECLHTFVEEGRFAQPYQSRQQGFLRTLEGMASDYMGKVTDRFKNRAHLACAFTLDGLRAVTIAQNQLVRVWDVQTGQETGMIKTGLPETRNKRGEIRNMCALSTNGAYLFSCNGDGFGTATLWETFSGRKLKEYRLPEEFWSVTVADDGRKVYVVVGSDLHILPGRD